MKTPVVINRNDIELPLKKETFGKKSKENVGKEFYAPELAVPKVEEIELNGEKQKVLTNITGLLWVGIEDVINLLNTSLRRTFAEIFIDNLDDNTGVFNEEKWLLDAAEFTSGVDSLTAILEQLDQLQTQMQGIVESDDFGAEDNGVKTEAAIKLEEQLRDLNARIKPLKVKKMAIKAEYEARAAKRAARKEKEAKAKGTSAPATEAVAA